MPIVLFGNKVDLIKPETTNIRQVTPNIAEKELSEGKGVVAEGCGLVDSSLENALKQMLRSNAIQTQNISITKESSTKELSLIHISEPTRPY